MHFQENSVIPERYQTSLTALSPLESYTRHIEHQRYQCPVYLWVSQGQYRSGESIFFVYIEYRDCTRACRYRQWQFSSLADACEFILQRAATSTLPAISRRMTCLSPIKLGH